MENSKDSEERRETNVDNIYLSFWQDHQDALRNSLFFLSGWTIIDALCSVYDNRSMKVFCAMFINTSLLAYSL